MAQHPDKNKWEEIATKQMRGKPLEGLNWMTPEGIEVKPLYVGTDEEYTNCQVIITKLKSMNGKNWDFYGEKFSKVKLSGGYDSGKYFISNIEANNIFILLSIGFK